MSFLLPLVALALAALSRFILKDREPLDWRFDRPRALALLFVTVVMGVIAARFSPEIDKSGIEIGVLIGAACVFFGGWVGGSIAPIAIGVAAAASMHTLRHTTVPNADLALIASTGFAAMVFGAEGGTTAAIAATLCAATDNLGFRHIATPGAALLGSEVGLSVAIGALVSIWLPSTLSALKAVVVGLIAVAGVFLVAKKLVDLSYATVAAIGAVSAVVLDWLLPDDESDTMRLGIATVIGIGVATVTFGLARGVGMAISLAACAGTLLAIGNRKALLTLGPLLGLVLYRVLREAGTGATRALDIGQHYALLGVVLGTILPLLPADWNVAAGMRRAVGSFLWGILLLAVPPMLIVMLGMKGSVGFVVGLGIAALIQAIRRQSSLLPLPVAAAIGSGTILALGWMKDAVEMSRDEKVHFFLIAGSAVIVLAGLIALLSRTTKTEGMEVAK